MFDELSILLRCEIPDSFEIQKHKNDKLLTLFKQNKKSSRFFRRFLVERSSLSQAAQVRRVCLLL